MRKRQIKKNAKKRLAAIGRAICGNVTFKFKMLSRCGGKPTPFEIEPAAATLVIAPMQGGMSTPPEFYEQFGAK